MSIPPLSDGCIECIDVSGWQHPKTTSHPNGAPIAWQAVAASGVKAAYIKATQGTGYLSPFLEQDVRTAAAAGLDVGVYHYLDHADPQAQAAHLLAAVAPLLPWLTLPWALDVETGHDEIAPIAAAVLAAAEPDLGEAVIYTYEHFQAVLKSEAVFGQRRLWIAEYNARLPALGGPWAGQAFWGWQYSGKATVPGVPTPCDRSRLRWVVEDAEPATPRTAGDGLG